MIKITKSPILILSLFILLLFSSSVVKGEGNSAAELVNEAITQKSFYYYNEAYSAIMQLTDENEKGILLGKLASVSNRVWNDDIVKVNNILQELVNTASGKIYDDVQVVINQSNIIQIDKDYLLGEVTSWGRKLVWTDDYKLAVDALMDAWNKKDANSIARGETAITKLKNQYSKDYLLRELNILKKSIYVPKLQISNFSSVTINDKSVSLALYIINNDSKTVKLSKIEVYEKGALVSTYTKNDLINNKTVVDMAPNKTWEMSINLKPSIWLDNSYVKYYVECDGINFEFKIDLLNP